MKMIKQSIKNKINERISMICSRFHDGIPMESIFLACKDNGYEPLQEDGTPWSGFLCGRDGKAIIDLSNTSSTLVLYWHKFETTGRYEVVSYVS